MEGEDAVKANLRNAEAEAKLAAEASKLCPQFAYCEYCKRPFPSQETANMHLAFCPARRRVLPLTSINITNKGSKMKKTYRYICYYCEFVFYDEKHYYEHMSKSRYVCQVCHSHFESRKRLKTHYCLKFLKDVRKKIAEPEPPRPPQQ